MKESLADKVSRALLKNGYVVKNIKGCFDLVARKQDSIILLKTLENTNSLTKETADEMKRIAQITKHYKT